MFSALSTSAHRWVGPRDFPPVGRIPEGRMVELPGRGRTYVTEAGDPDAPPLLLLHGLACTGLLNWYPALPDLTARYRVVVFDQRWHGRGIRSPQFTLEDCADDVVAVADALGIDRFTVVGSSMGSLVAQLTWRAHADRTAALVLGATTAGFRRRPRERLILDAFVRGIDLAKPGPGLVPPGVSISPDGRRFADKRWIYEQFRQTRGGAIGQVTAAISRFDSSTWIADIDVPTAVIVNSDDWLIPTRRQRWLARQIEGAAVFAVEGGHTSCIMGVHRYLPALSAACASVTNRI